MLFIVISPRASPPALSEFGLVYVLPGLGAFLLIRGSAFQATAHDAAHDAFMALPPYTWSREGLARQLGSGPKPCRVGPGVRKYAPCSSNRLAHHEMALTCLQPVFLYVTTCHQQDQRR